MLLKSALNKEVMKNQTAAKLDALKRLQARIAAELDALGISHLQEFKE
jgi:hypothetical protein